MKRLFFILAIIAAMLAAGSPALFADDSSAITITAKQGFIMPWNEPVVKNLTTFEVVKTKKIDSWGSWNALWEDWSLDAGFAYDATGVNTGALLIGRNFGTLGDYIPLNFPLKDKITITIYPVGLYINDLTDHPTIRGCSGGAIIKAEIKFG